MLCWLTIGEVDSAEAVARAITDSMERDRALLPVANFRGATDQIEQVAQRILGRTDSDPQIRDEARSSLASRAVNRGEVQEAWNLLDRANTDASVASDASVMNLAFWRQALMLLAYGPIPGPEARCDDLSGSLDATISKGLRALVDGDPSRARAIAGELEQRFGAHPGMLEGAPALLRAWAASLEGRDEEVLREASNVLALSGPESYFAIRKPAARWLMARSYESLGQADSAVVHYRAALLRTNVNSWELVATSLIELSVRQRLVIAETRAGNAESARTEREILARRVDRPDAIAAAGLAEADLVLAMTPGGGPRASQRRN